MSLPLQDPFSGLESTLGAPHEDCLGSSEQLVQRLNKDEEVMSTPVDDIEVEEGLEVGEELNLTPDPLPEVVPPAPAMPPAPRYQLPPALIDLINPLLVCLLAISNFLLPSWLAGFTTGLLLTALAAYWLVTYLHPPVSHSCTPVTASSPIPVPEPPAQVQAWMNLLPHQFHPYDVDIHDVPELESDDVFKMDFERADPRVFYLFARADREKEDLYKSLMDAHHFLTDTVLDVARREGAITEGIDRDAK